jgi:hypothetical protein
MDVRVLNGTRPKGTRAQQNVSGYLSLNQPAPSSLADSIFVVIPSHSTQIPVEFVSGVWDVRSDGSLPVAQTYFLIAYDENGAPFPIRWGGIYQF